MSFENIGVFWESPDDSVPAGRAVKLTAAHQDLLSYEWYIHTDTEPTAKEAVYATTFQLRGLGAKEWPVTIRTRLVASWEVRRDSIGKDTVDRYITLYDDPTNFVDSYYDTSALRNHEYQVPPYLGAFSGHLTSNPSENLTVLIDTFMYGSPNSIYTQKVIGWVHGLPLDCGNHYKINNSTDRHFTSDKYESALVPNTKFDPDKFIPCGYPVFQGAFDPYTQKIHIRFGYDKTPRPDDHDWDFVWEGRVIDEFVGYKIP